MKTLNIHIGHYKTGTTALQIYMARNAGALRRRGLDYAPDFLNHSKHSIFAFSLYRAAGVTSLMHGYAKPTAPEDIWAQLFEHVRKSRARNVLISSEEFMRLGLFPSAESRLARIVAEAREEMRFRIIAYLRPPGAHLASWFNQMVKMRQPLPAFERAATEAIEAIHYDYDAAIRPWSRLFGTDSVELHAYRRDPSDPQALIRHFLGLFDIQPPGDLAKPEKDPNPRLDDRFVDLVRLLQNANVPASAVKAFIDQVSAVAAEIDGGLSSDAERFEELAARSRRGIAALPDLARLDFDVEALTSELPEIRSAEVEARDILIQALATEFLKLRRRVNLAGIEDLGSRLEHLEARLAALEK